MECLSTARARWRELGQTPGARLLKLAILRALARELHARALDPRARELSPKVERLREREDLSPELAVLLARDASGETPGKARSALPDAVVRALGRERLERSDRAWERALAIEAHRRGWGFWSAEATLDARTAQVFHQTLEAALGQEGILLFVESATQGARPPSSTGTAASAWRGRWFIVLEPGIADPAPKFAPVLAVHPVPLLWTRLFTP
jgi:hypothetical protein